MFNVSCHPVHPSVHLINCTPGSGRRGGGFFCSSADLIQVSEGRAGARDREDRRKEILNESEDSVTSDEGCVYECVCWGVLLSSSNAFCRSTVSCYVLLPNRTNLPSCWQPYMLELNVKSGSFSPLDSLSPDFDK